MMGKTRVVKLEHDFDRLFINVKSRFVYFEALIDNTGNSFKIEKSKLLEMLK